MPEIKEIQEIKNMVDNNIKDDFYYLGVEVKELTSLIFSTLNKAMQVISDFHKERG